MDSDEDYCEDCIVDYTEEIAEIALKILYGGKVFDRINNRRD